MNKSPLKGLDSRSKSLLSIVLQDDIIKGQIAVVNGATANNVQIQQDGSVKVYPSSKWWSSICGDVKTLSFDDLCLTIIDSLSGHTNSKNKTVLEGLMEHFNDYRFKQKLSKDEIVDYIFLVYFLNFDGKTKSILDNGFSPFEEASNCKMMVNLGGETVAMPFTIVKG